MITELKPIYDSRKSFYNKANVEFNNEEQTATLYSYNTKVAQIKFKGKEKAKATVLNTQSPTTTRHVKEFLLQNGFKAETKKQIEEDY